MHKLLLIFTLISALFFTVSCDSGVKFENPKDKNSDAYDPEAVENDDDEDTETNDNDTDNDSEDSGKYYSESNRVVIQLGSKQGFKSKAETEEKEGTIVDLDLHLVKRTSLEAEKYRFERKDGLLGTKQRLKGGECPTTWLECEEYWRHDDCSFSDPGIISGNIEETVSWNAQFIYDNTWGGGGNYENPETIALGSTKDEINNVTGEKKPDGLPDDGIRDDQYLVVASYVNCISRYDDGIDRCDESYKKEDGAYEIDARVKILVDGEEVPRDAVSDRPADHYYKTTKNFKLKYGEWKVVAVIKWDNSLQGPLPELKGNAIISDTYLPEYGIEIDPVRYPVCFYDNADANLVPVWDRQAYFDFVTTTNPETNTKLGSCSNPPEPENPYTGDKRKADCKNLPKNAEWNQVSEIDQEWNGTEWLPSVEGTLNEEPSKSECRFKCKENYSWDDSGTSQGCIADQRLELCDGMLPANAVWNDNGNEGYYTQTWTGEAGGWQPQYKGIAFSDTPGECIYNCLERYSWNGIACEPSPEMLPDCSPESGTPCKDSTIGLIWSANGSATYDEAVNICNSLNYSAYGGFTDGWHLPTISELRTLIKDCPGTILPGGTCEVREDNNVNCLGKEEYDCQGESCYSCTGDPDGGYSKFGETGVFWSSSAYWDDPDNSAWLVGFQGADIHHLLKSETHSGRCVRSICLNGYYWNGSSCQANTRNANCPSSKPENTEWNDDGRGGTFTQTYDIWEGAWGPESRNTIYSQNSGECHYKCANNYLWNYNSKCEYYTTVLPECSESSGTPCYDSSSGLAWSELESAMTWDEAVTFCPGHTEGDLNGWSLPTIDELRTLIKNCESTVTGGNCGVTNNCLSSSCQDSICVSCEYRDDGQYSKFGETGLFWSSSTVEDNANHSWRVNFDYGHVEWGEEDFCSVRCVKR